MDIPLIANLHDLHQRRQFIIDEKLRRSNLKCHSCDYQIGQQVLILVDKPDKLQDCSFGPSLLYEYIRMALLQSNVINITMRELPFDELKLIMFNVISWCGRVNDLGLIT